MHISERNARSKDSPTYARKWLLKEHNTISVHFVCAHGDELLKRPCLLSKTKPDTRCWQCLLVQRHTADVDRGHHVTG